MERNARQDATLHARAASPESRLTPPAASSTEFGRAYEAKDEEEERT
jgi:hypothetical protein